MMPSGVIGKGVPRGTVAAEIYLKTAMLLSAER